MPPLLSQAATLRRAESFATSAARLLASRCSSCWSCLAISLSAAGSAGGPPYTRGSSSLCLPVSMGGILPKGFVIASSNRSATLLCCGFLGREGGPAWCGEVALLLPACWGSPATIFTFLYICVLFIGLRSQRFIAIYVQVRIRS